MARGRSGGTAVEDQPVTPAGTSTEADLTATEPNGENANTAETPTETPAAPAADAKVELTDEQIAAAIVPFQTALAEAVAKRDENTGTVPEADIATVNKVYSELTGGTKVKNAAKNALGDAMREAMDEMDIVLARAHMEIEKQLKAAGGKKSGTKREPVDPTEAFVSRVTVLALANSLVANEAPEGVDEKWVDKVNEALEGVDLDAVKAYRTWFTSDAEDKGDQPESATPLIVSAVKLSLGKSAKPGKAVKATAGESYSGPTRSIGKHITEAFDAKATGDFLKVSEIRSFVSTDYPNERPSAGAISMRLFPKKGKCTVEGVTPGTNESGDKGAYKN